MMEVQEAIMHLGTLRNTVGELGSEKKAEDALALAIAALRSMPEIGEPLAIEQVRSMSGQPVWLSKMYGDGFREEWSLLFGYEDGSGRFLFVNSRGISELYETKNYGRTWFAYACSPICAK